MTRHSGFQQTLASVPLPSDTTLGEQEAESRLATPRRRIPAHGSTAPQEDTQQDTQKESSDAWDAREWRGTFVQNAATSIQMALKMRAIAPQPQGEAGALLCSGEVTWGGGQGVLDFQGEIRGSQISLQEKSVLFDATGGTFVPGTRYLLWKRGGALSGVWLHGEHGEWGMLQLFREDAPANITVTSSQPREPRDVSPHGIAARRAHAPPAARAASACAPPSPNWAAYHTPPPARGLRFQIDREPQTRPGEQASCPSFPNLKPYIPNPPKP